METLQGPVMGEVTENGIHNFKGIPYAQAPVGDMRFRAPGPAPQFQTAFAATEFSPMCLQSLDTGSALVERIVDGHGLSAPKRWMIKRVAASMDAGETSEDCLYLNVRTPDPEANLPVMVWIHGGGHQFGSGDFNIYQGDALPGLGVVVVTINYRLNVFGYMAHPLLSSEDPDRVSGNYGLRDQIAALEWVRDNISAYGGDPERVTLFGESAGASSIAAIMASPMAEGLFHGAILQSGETTQSLTQLRGDSRGPSAEDIGAAIVAAIPEDTPRTASDLRALPAESFLKQSDFMAHSAVLRPVADGVILPRSVAEIFADGSFRPVPVIAGFNADEAVIFYEGPQGSALRADIDKETKAEQLAELRAGYGDAAGTAIASLYGLNGREGLDKIATDIAGDEYFGLSARFTLESAEAVGAPGWAYAFTRVPPSRKQTIGAFHSAEMPFVFGTHEKALGLSDEDDTLTQLMQAYWVSFAEDGNPNADGLPEWPQYGDRNWMEFTANTDKKSGIVQDWRRLKLDALEAGLDPVLRRER